MLWVDRNYWKQYCHFNLWIFGNFPPRSLYFLLILNFVSVNFWIVAFITAVAWIDIQPRTALRFTHAFSPIYSIHQMPSEDMYVCVINIDILVHKYNINNVHVKLLKLNVNHPARSLKHRPDDYKTHNFKAKSKRDFIDLVVCIHVSMTPPRFRRRKKYAFAFELLTSSNRRICV